MNERKNQRPATAMEQAFRNAAQRLANKKTQPPTPKPQEKKK